MATSNITPHTEAQPEVPGKDVGALGPSDSSDSGSDVQGERPMATEPDNPAQWGAVTAKPETDTDAAGTGERASAAGDAPVEAVDLRPDHIEPAQPGRQQRRG